MSRIQTVLAVVGILLLYGCIGSMDLEAQERADAYAQDARAEARRAAQQLARELRMQGRLDDATRMSSPVALK